MQKLFELLSSWIGQTLDFKFIRLYGLRNLVVREL